MGTWLFTGKWLTLGAFGGTNTCADAIDVGMWVGRRYPCSINPPPGGLYRVPLFLLLLLLLHLLLLHLLLRRLSNDAGMSDDIYIILRLGGG